MVKTLANKIIEQINPLEDHKKRDFQGLFFSPENSKDSKKVLCQNAVDFILTSMFKPIVRGGVVGGIIGAGIGYVTGEDIAMYTGEGIKYGAIIDAMQYNLRGASCLLNSLNSKLKSEEKR